MVLLPQICCHTLEHATKRHVHILLLPTVVRSSPATISCKCLGLILPYNQIVSPVGSQLQDGMLAIIIFRRRRPNTTSALSSAPDSDFWKISHGSGKASEVRV